MDKILAAAGQAASSGAIGNIAGQLANAADTTSVADFAQGALEKGMGAYDSMDPAAKAKLGAAGKAALPGFLQAAQAAATAAGAPGASAALGGILSGDTAGVPNPGGMLGAYLGDKIKQKLAGTPAAAATPAALAAQAAPAAAVPVATPVAAQGAAAVAGLNGPVSEEQARAASILHKDLGIPPQAALAAAQGAPTPGLFDTVGAAISGAGRKKRKTYRKKRAARKTGRKLGSKPRRKL